MARWLNTALGAGTHGTEYSSDPGAPKVCKEPVCMYICTQHPDGMKERVLWHDPVPLGSALFQ